MNRGRELVYRFFELPTIKQRDALRDMGMLGVVTENDDMRIHLHIIIDQREDALLADLWDNINDQDSAGYDKPNPYRTKEEPMSDKQTIAIDYDDTFSADPEMWILVIQTWKDYGYQVICVTARKPTFENRKELSDALPDDIPLLLAYDEPKRQFAEKQGFKVDIWVDDTPEAITQEIYK